jgi:hypothetical protein
MKNRSLIAEQMAQYLTMVSDNLIKERKQHSSVHDVLQDHPKEVALFKRSSGDFSLHDHPEFFQDLFDFYSDTGEMPYGTMKARDGDPYEWIHNALMDEILGGEPDDSDIGKDASHDDYDQDIEYDDENDYGQYDHFENKTNIDIDEDNETYTMFRNETLSLLVNRLKGINNDITNNTIDKGKIQRTLEIIISELNTIRANSSNKDYQSPQKHTDIYSERK